MLKYPNISHYYSTLLGLLLWAASPQIAAQNIYFEWQQDIPLTNQTKKMLLAWVGGLNSPQFSSYDLNQDQKPDLIVFERTAGKVYTFLTDAAGIYQYAPQYEACFPAGLKGWLLLRDYDHDGRADLFTHTPFGIKVYQNITPANAPPQWQLVMDPIRTKGFRGMVNLQVNMMDIPIIQDLDSDGDLDILCFDFAQGSWLELHQNMSQEKYKNANQLDFERKSSCWGGLIEGADCGDYTFGYVCEVESMGGGGGAVIPPKTMHVGSTLALKDLNGDGLLDALIGDVSCPYIYYLPNVGTAQKALFKEFDQAFPPSKPIVLEEFPAVFFEDINADGKQDMLVSPNVFSNSENKIDFQHSVWLYENVGSESKPDFQFRQNDFLQSEMLEVGENAFPALQDLDADGDLDMLVGERGNMTENNFKARLQHYQNIGTAQKPHFTLIDEDYLGLSAWQITDIKPFFFDINADNAPDLGLVYHQGKEAKLLFFINQAKKGTAFKLDTKKTFEPNISLEYGDFPYFFTSPTDQKTHIFLGKRRGNLTHLIEENPSSYTLKTDTLGGIKKQGIRHHLNPVLVDFNQNGIPDLLTGDGEGILRLYPDFDLQSEQTWQAKTLLFKNILLNSFLEEDLGASIFPVVSDLNADGIPDLIIGLHTGGIRIAYGIK